jgi:hypothetical protein
VTDTLRTYSDLGLKLFYSANTATYGQNTPALAAAPSISQVASSVNGASVSISAHVTGDPAAGIQSVWVTYTGENGPYHGRWASLDLTQDRNDSTLWTGTLPLPAGQDASDVRFLVQAANGVGLVGIDDNLGADYTPGVVPGAVPPDAAPTGLALDPVPSSVAFGDTMTVGATLTGAPAGSTVIFDIGQGAVPATTDAAGRAGVSIAVSGTIGTHRLTATYAGDADHQPSSAQSEPFTETKAPTALALGSTKRRVVLAGRALDTGLYATLTTAGTPLPRKAVVFTLTRAVTGKVTTIARTTGPDGRAMLGPVDVRAGKYTISAAFGTADAGTTVDPDYAASHSDSASVLLTPGIVVMLK